MVADAELSDPRNSNVRLRRYDPSTETPTYQQTFSFAGEQTVQLYANEHRAVMILRGNCSTSSCANPTHRMISVEALTGIQVFNIELGAYPNFVLQNTLETIVALGNGRVRRFSATGVLIWDSALNLGGPIIGTILALDNNRAKLWAASQQPEPNGPGGLRYNLRLHL